MQCFVYRSNRKLETYLYLAKQDGFEALPEPLRKVFGPPEFVMELELSPERQLARENTLDVMNHLKTEGFFLQMPPADINKHLKL